MTPSEGSGRAVIFMSSLLLLYKHAKRNLYNYVIIVILKITLCKMISMAAGALRHA